MPSQKLTVFRSTRNEENKNIINLEINLEIIRDFATALKSLNTKNVKVLTIIGKTNSGKSTLLNCLLSKIFMDYYRQSGGFTSDKYSIANQNIFESASEMDNIKRRINAKNIQTGCTYGMDTYLLRGSEKDSYYLFVDVQGICGYETDVEPIVILLSYYISDLMIVNTVDLDATSFQLLDSIKKYNNEFQNASLCNKPHILFRSADRKPNTIDAIVNTQYSTMMEDRLDSHQQIRMCLKNYFTPTAPPYVWSEYPSTISLNTSKNKDNIAFMLNTTNYEKMCDTILKIFDSIPSQTKDLSQILIDKSELINHSFSKLDASVFEMDKSTIEEKMKQWFRIELEKNGSYSDLKQPLIIENCSEDTYTLLNNRKNRIQACKDDFKTTFMTSPNLNVGLEVFKNNIEQKFEHLQEVFNSHVKNVLQYVQKNVRERINNIEISNTTDTWMALNEYMKLVDIYIDERLVSKEARFQLLQNFEHQYYKISEKFSLFREEFINNVKTRIEACKTRIKEQKNKQIIINNLNRYIDKLELKHHDIVCILLNEIQEEFQIIFDYEIIDVETKLPKADEKCNRCILTPISYYKLEFDIDGSIKDIKGSIKGNGYVNITNIELQLFSMFDELRNLYMNNKTHFENVRKSELPKILKLYNAKGDCKKAELFHKIEYLDLYMLDRAFDIDNSFPSQLLFSIPESWNIMTYDQFKNHFGEQFVKWYKIYKKIPDENGKTYIMEKFLFEEFVKKYYSMK